MSSLSRDDCLIERISKVSGCLWRLVRGGSCIDSCSIGSVSSIF